MAIRASTEEARRILQSSVDGDLVSYLENNPVTDEQLRDEIRCTSGCTALHWAAGTNQLDAIRYLIRERSMPVDIPATRKARGRTPLHYACRNGHLEAAKLLVELVVAEVAVNGDTTTTSILVNAVAKHGVTPFQLAVWQNQLQVCQWLVDEHGVDPHQTNDFDCAAVHWLGICPFERATTKQIPRNMHHHGVDDDGIRNTTMTTSGDALLPMAQWLASLETTTSTKTRGEDMFAKRQTQGHSALHKAAWGGHLILLQYLHEHHGMWDDTPDGAGNYAADLADMAQSDRHAECARYLRQSCNATRQEAYRIVLGRSVSSNGNVVVVDGDDPKEIRKAYLAKAKLLHPDRSTNTISKPGAEDDNVVSDKFVELQRAYEHLLQDEDDGRGFSQSNPAHSLNLMLQVSGVKEDSTIKNQDGGDMDCFKARLIAVLLEYGDKGLSLSNVKKKWKQVWPNTPFPSGTSIKDGETQRRRRRRTPLATFIRQHAGDVVDLVEVKSSSDEDDGGKASSSCILVVPKHCTRAHVVAAHVERERHET